MLRISCSTIISEKAVFSEQRRLKQKINETFLSQIEQQKFEGCQVLFGENWVIARKVLYVHPHNL